MASKELCKKFEEFCTLAGSDAKKMNSKASGKLAADCFDKDKEFHKHDVKSIVDASVFPACKEKGTPNMPVNPENVEKYITKTAHELAKRKTKNNKLDVADPAVLEIKEKLISYITGGGPDVKATKESATGGVSRMTDSSQYTGSHKERFDADGKGKGIEGREERAENSGYVGNYKGKDTFDEKAKK